MLFMFLQTWQSSQRAVFLGLGGRGQKFPLILCNYDTENIWRWRFWAVATALLGAGSYVSPTRLGPAWGMFTPCLVALG